MPIITKDQAKVFLQIDVSDTTKDALITALIPVVQGKVCAYCNTDFLDDAGAEAWPVGINLDFVPLLKYYMALPGKLENSESIPGGYSVQYKSEAEMMKPFTKYRKLP
jgi:hypothetical protein